jgi:hypothetical protein
MRIPIRILPFTLIWILLVTLMRIRIQFITLMRIQIQLITLMWIWNLDADLDPTFQFDPEPDPQRCPTLLYRRWWVDRLSAKASCSA